MKTVKKAIWTKVRKVENEFLGSIPVFLELAVLYDDGSYDTFEIEVSPLGFSSVKICNGKRASLMDFRKWFDITRLSRSKFTNEEVLKYIDFKKRKWQNHKLGELDYSDTWEEI